MISTTVPTTVDETAKLRVDELGASRELDMMLEHADRTIPGLVRIDVTCQPDYTPGGEPAVILDAVVKTADVDEQLAIERAWNSWRYTALPPRVATHFLLMTVAESANEG